MHRSILNCAPFVLILAASALSLSAIGQGLPKKNSIIGIAMGDSVKTVEARLAVLYPGCELDSREYQDQAPYGSPPAFTRVGTVSPSEGEPCTESQKQSGRADMVQVDYVHASRDAQSSAYKIQLQRIYEGFDRSVIGGLALDDLIQALTAEYGPPLASSQKVDEVINQLRRRLRTQEKPTTPYVTKMMWSAKRPDKSGFCFEADCGPVTLEAKIDSEGSAGAKRLRVTRVWLTMTDLVLSGKHWEWRHEFDQLKEKGLKTF